jgi:hypothetical protein
MPIKEQSAPVLLFNDECGVCRSIASWVTKQVQAGSGTSSIVVRPIGQDPEELRALNQDLNIACGVACPSRTQAGEYWIAS